MQTVSREHLQLSSYINIELDKVLFLFLFYVLTPQSRLFPRRPHPTTNILRVEPRSPLPMHSFFLRFLLWGKKLQLLYDSAAKKIKRGGFAFLFLLKSAIVGDRPGGMLGSPPPDKKNGSQGVI